MTLFRSLLKLRHIWDHWSNFLSPFALHPFAVFEKQCILKRNQRISADLCFTDIMLVLFSILHPNAYSEIWRSAHIQQPPLTVSHVYYVSRIWAHPLAVGHRWQSVCINNRLVCDWRCREGWNEVRTLSWKDGLLWKAKQPLSSRQNKGPALIRLNWVTWSWYSFLYHQCWKFSCSSWTKHLSTFKEHD